MKRGQLKRGDVVYLKSKGPPMTVTQVSDDEQHVDVSWFIANGTVESGHFHIDCLYVAQDKITGTERIPGT